jgi:hypothetical protein
MPGLDGTGPQGAGPRTGQGAGQCRRPKKDDEQETRVETVETEGGESQPPAWEPEGRRIRRRGQAGQGGGRGRGRRRGQRMGQGAGAR